ncbi:hypothetical protein [Paraburkholderia sp. SIMBA_027]|uniref:hypothetical protein n=1 Tax=Paraburkholderia sp. SIMBA_027 TaxID=3085770 RepID=UPI00397882AA
MKNNSRHARRNAPPEPLEAARASNSGASAPDDFQQLLTPAIVQIISGLGPIRSQTGIQRFRKRHSRRIAVDKHKAWHALPLFLTDGINVTSILSNRLQRCLIRAVQFIRRIRHEVTVHDFASNISAGQGRAQRQSGLCCQ